MLGFQDIKLLDVGNTLSAANLESGSIQEDATIVKISLQLELNIKVWKRAEGCRAAWVEVLNYIGALDVAQQEAEVMLRANSGLISELGMHECSISRFVFKNLLLCAANIWAFHSHS